MLVLPPHFHPTFLSSRHPLHPLKNKDMFYKMGESKVLIWVPLQALSPLRILMKTEILYLLMSVAISRTVKLFELTYYFSHSWTLEVVLVYCKNGIIWNNYSRYQFMIVRYYWTKEIVIRIFHAWWHYYCELWMVAVLKDNETAIEL